MSRFAEGLNPEQARAVMTLDGPLLILAGAGSGKTRVLTRRVANLLERGTVGPGMYAPRLNPWNILAVTFTNKAAGEMRERVHQLVGEVAKHVWVSTFHSSCVRILRRDIEVLGFRRDFVIYDDDDQTRVVKAVLDDLRISHKDLPPNAVRARIDRTKNRLKSDFETTPKGDPFPTIFENYNQRLKRNNALDFNDIVNKVVDIWDGYPTILERWQNQFRYVLVDEYQDTNPAQYRLLTLLAARDKNLAVVGDDDQSIYSFRGADIRNILGFEKDFPSATVVKLEQNYRSTATILRAASAVVKHNHQRKEKTLRTEAPAGEPIELMLGPDEESEAASVVGEIRRQLRARRPSDLAIIYRTNAQSRSFEQALTRERIPHILVGGRKFYDRMEVKDIVGYLRLLLNPDDDVAFQRVVNTPTRGLGDKAIDNLRSEASRAGTPLRIAARAMGSLGGRAGNAFAAFSLMMDRFESAARLMPLSDLVLYVATETGYFGMLEKEGTEEAKGREENIRELARAAGESLADPGGFGQEVDDDLDAIGKLQQFLDRASLSAQSDDLPDAEGGAVTLLTAHLAKGLEFPVVFLVGMVEKCFPHARSEREEEIEEERRLAYVAITRARERLFISAPLRRRAPDGWWEDATLSRFIHEIPSDAMNRPASSMRAAAMSFGTPARAPAWGGAARPASSPSRPAFGSPRASAEPPRPAAAPPRNAPRPADLRTLAPDSMEVFKEGVQVFHPTHGVGTISRREGIASNPRLTIHFAVHGPRTVFAVTAGLEILIP